MSVCAAEPTLEEEEDVMRVTAARAKGDSHSTTSPNAGVFDQQTLADHHIDDLNQLLREVPNVGFSALGEGRSTYLSMRGIGSLAQPLGHDDTSVVTYIDGVPQSLFAADTRFLDVARVDVLRGPQGTLFGRNALAGAINLMTRQPDDVAEGELRIETGLGPGGEDLGQVRLSGPLSETRLLGGFSAAYAHQAPDIPNLAPGGKLGKAESATVRGTLVARSDDISRLTLTAHHGRDRHTPANFVLRHTAHFPQVALTPRGGAARELKGVSLNGERQLTWAQLTSVTAWNAYDFSNLTNNGDALTFSQLFDRPFADFLPAQDWSTYDEHQQSLYQEFRLSQRDHQGVGWSSGLNYLHDDYQLYSHYASPTFPSISGRRHHHNQLDSYAVFGDVTVPLATRFTGAVGGRFTHERKGYVARYRGDGAAETVDAFDQQGTLTSEMLTGRVMLSYMPSDTHHLYVSATRGAKSGGFPNFTHNAPVGQPDAPYKPTSVWSYELGSKQQALQGRAEWHLALFYNAVKQENLMAKDASSFVFMPKSVDTDSYGTELAGAWLLADAWRLSGGLGYTRATLRHVSDDVAATGARSGYAVPAVPRVTSHLTLQYFTSAAELGLATANVFALVQHQYVGAREADIGNHFTLNAYQQVNTRVGLEFDQFDVYLFVQNLTDVRPEYIGLWYGPGTETVTVGQGRMIGAGMKVRL